MSAEKVDLEALDLVLAVAMMCCELRENKKLLRNEKLERSEFTQTKERAKKGHLSV
jgi:hypothetical protein